MTTNGSLTIPCYGCGAPGVILIVTEDHAQPIGPAHCLSAQGVCADHAVEEAHEAAASMSAEEYVIVNLSTHRQVAAWRDTAEQALRVTAETAAQLVDVNARLESIITGE